MKSKLSVHTPKLIKEALLLKTAQFANEEAIIKELYSTIPIKDNDRKSFLRQLNLACLGYNKPAKVVIKDVQDQLSGTGFKDWLTAWNTIRWIPGQAKRMKKELNEYLIEYSNTHKFPWVPTIIGYIIMLVRLDHPEYKK